MATKWPKYVNMACLCSRHRQHHRQPAKTPLSMSKPAATPPAPQAHAIHIEAIAGKAGLRRFINMPKPLYRQQPHWVTPLFIERYLHLSDHNPYFKHAHWQGWLATRDGQPVGRISAQIDQSRLDRYNDATGYFGFLDAVDDAEVFQALLDTAGNWLAEQGMQRVRGPFNFSTNHDCGLLVEGFDTPPSVMMPHNPPYYAAQLLAAGFEPAKDLLAFRIASDFEVPRAAQLMIDRCREQIRLRPLRRKQQAEDFRIIGEIFNDAWSDNWEFVPFSEAEILDIGSTLVHLIKDDYLQIAEVDGEPIGMVVMLPNLNELIADLDGSLLPLGWVKLLRRLKGDRATTARLPLLGIKKSWQASRRGTAMVYQLVAALRKPAQRDGIKQVELSWILEDNRPMRHIIESVKGDAYKRYRIYQKSLPAKSAEPAERPEGG